MRSIVFRLQVWVVLTVFVGQQFSCCASASATDVAHPIWIEHEHHIDVSAHDHCCHHHHGPVSSHDHDEEEQNDSSPDHSHHLCTATHLVYVPGRVIELDPPHCDGFVSHVLFEFVSVIPGTVDALNLADARSQLFTAPLRAQLQVFRC